MSILEKLFLFNGLKPYESKEIISLFKEPTQFKKGDIIYSAEKFPNAIGVVLKGKAYALADNENELHMKTFESGACFGAAAVFRKGEKYVSTIVAKSDLKVLFIDEDDLRKIFLKYPQTALNYINFLSEKIGFLNAKLNLLSCGSAEMTVYKYLCSVTDDNCVAQIPQSMTLLSKMLGIGRATLYRCLDTLEAEKMILRENNIIKVIKNEKNS